jgi:hypothetical protein
MKKITLFCSTIISLSLSAQVTLTQSDFPISGSTYILQLSDTAGVMPGASGTGANWNFASSNSNVGTMTDSFKTVSSTPYAGSYPQANLAVHETAPNVDYFIYFNQSSSSVDRVGNADTLSVITYYNPATQYLFPMTYGTTGTDTYAANYFDVPSGNTIHYHGTGTVNGDGLGTITLPTGTYTNVLRVHYTRSETDTIFTVSSGNFPVHVTENYYLWFQNGSYYPIFHLQTTANQFGNGPVSYKKVVGWRAGNSSAGIAENELSSISVFPNPASSTIFIHSSAQNIPKTISLFDAEGKLIRALNSPMENCEMEASDLSSGIYFILIQFADGKTETKKIQLNN